LLSVASNTEYLKQNNINLSAIVVFTPFVDGVDFIRHNSIPRFGLSTVKLFIFGFQDLILSYFDKNRYVKMLAPPSQTRLVTGDDWEVIKGLTEYDEKRGTWQNKLPARSLFELLLYRPIAKAGSINIPTLIASALEDDYISPTALRTLHEKIPHSTLKERHTGHCGFLNEAFDEASKFTINFFAEYLN